MHILLINAILYFELLQKMQVELIMAHMSVRMRESDLKYFFICIFSILKELKLFFGLNNDIIM